MKSRLSLPSPQVLLLQYFMIYKSSILKLFKLFYKNCILWCMCSQKSLFHYFSVISVRQCTDIFLYFYSVYLNWNPKNSSLILPPPFNPLPLVTAILFSLSMNLIFLCLFFSLIPHCPIAITHYFQKYSSKIINVQLKKIHMKVERDKNDWIFYEIT